MQTKQKQHEYGKHYPVYDKQNSHTFENKIHMHMKNDNNIHTKQNTVYIRNKYPTAKKKKKINLTTKHHLHAEKKYTHTYEKK